MKLAKMQEDCSKAKKDVRVVQRQNAVLMMHEEVLKIELGSLQDLKDVVVTAIRVFYIILM